VTNDIQVFYYKITQDCRCGTRKLYTLQFPFIVNFYVQLGTVKNKPGLSVNGLV